MVDRDTKTLSLLSTDTGGLKLSVGETSTLTDLGVVSDGGASDGGSEGLERSGSEGGGLGGSGSTTAGLLAGLVEPGLHSSLE